MLFTPLLPNAGPTGGEGDACPAPTINLTIWSFDIAFLAIANVNVNVNVSVNVHAHFEMDGFAEKSSEVFGVEFFRGDLERSCFPKRATWRHLMHC